MKRVKLTVSYDGTAYCGWQYQKNGITIEEVLNKALSGLLKEPIAVIGASRTDSGVHALGNVAVFDTENRMPADKICLALNQRLPDDIRIQESEEVAADFHPRRQNCVKTYEYRIFNRKIDMPTQRLYTYFYYVPLDFDKMAEAAQYLVGEHDFKSFCTVRAQAEETVRTIYSLELDKRGDIITFRIAGSGFLYNMVRIIVGTLIKVGAGAYLPVQMEEILDARNRQAAGPKVPAQGLTLICLDYEKEPVKEIVGENKYWHYKIDQSRMAETGETLVSVYRCADEEWYGLLRRIIHQSYRNGARQVYAADLEKQRLIKGESYGFYRVSGLGYHPAPDGLQAALWCAITDEWRN